MIKNILVVGLIVCLVCGMGNAGSTNYYFSGNGDPEYPNEGYITTESYGSIAAYTSGGASDPIISILYDTNGNTVNYSYYTRHTVFGSCGVLSYAGSYNKNEIHPSFRYLYTSTDDGLIAASATQSYNTNVNRGLASTIGVYQANYVPGCGVVRYASAFHRLSVSVTPLYNISGTTDCLSDVELFITGDMSLGTVEFNDTIKTYLFQNIISGLNYTLEFSDGHQYNFNVTTDVVYDYDDCSYTKYRFEESCGNLIPDSEGFYSEYWIGGGGISRNFYEPSGILDISNTTSYRFDVHTDTFIGQTGWIIDPVVDGTTYTLENPNIAWNLKVIVQNGSDSTLIDGAMVKVDQTCYCTSGYSTRQKMTVNGMVEYSDMSLQDASLMVMKTGYKILNENSTGYSTFLSGRSNFSSKTWIVKLAPSTSNNSSSFYEVSNKVDIHFRDVNGNRTSKILDTDAEVYLYYENNNTNEEAMTLKFQSSSTHTYFIDEQSWTIAYDDIGHKTIANSYFTPWDYSYRAVIYNSSIHGWNITIPLTVRNGTREIEQHYQNLTTNLWFRYAHDGRVDYRDDMSIAIHARSNNTTLMNIDVELWDNGVYKDHVNLTETEFAGADFPYYYTWNPIYDYETGHNYTVLMYGFDRTLLETDYVECISDETTRKNKLTIGVKDSHGTQLANAYIYLEGWGSLPTGSVYYNAYEGIDNGDYRYKATKSGYTGGGWDEVNLTDEDKIVWYILTEDYTATAFTQTKFEDRDIKEIFFPLMYFLLICLLLGGLKYVAS